MMNVEQSVEWELCRGNRSTRRKPAPVPLWPPQIPHDLTWARTRAAAVGNRRLTARAMARPVGTAYHDVCPKLICNSVWGWRRLEYRFSRNCVCYLDLQIIFSVGIFIPNSAAPSSGFLPWSLQFNPGWLHVRLVVDKVAPKHGFRRVYSVLPPLIIIPPLLHTHLSLPPEVYDSPDHAAQYHILSL
jgi:hypothetical protein